MKHLSRIPGFHRLSMNERRSALCERLQLGPDDIRRALEQGGLDASTADKMVENSLGTYALPFGLGLNFRVNGRDRLAPMVVEEPSVIAAASNAARMIRESGGFEGELLGELMIGQVQLHSVRDPVGARARILESSAELIEQARLAVSGLVARGGGPRSLEVRDLGDGYLVVHIYVDCLDAMGANLVNSVAEALGPRIARLAPGELGLRILSNLCDGRRVRVRCAVRAAELEVKAQAGPRPQSRGYSGEQVLGGVVQASAFAERDPYRAATHNKGIMNGIDAVVIATGNDFRAIEAGAHAYASRTGVYRPLARWWREGDRLLGELTLPLALGIVGGTLRIHRAARLALDLAQIESAGDLAVLAASVGLASNLAALRALVTHGIQRGHMSLHARSVAAAAGARGDEVEIVARAIAQGSSINLNAAQRTLGELRERRASAPLA